MASNSPIITGLTSYVNDHASDLLVKSMLGAKDTKYFQLMTGVKAPTHLQIMDVDVEFQPLSCGWSESGSTELSQRLLDPKALMIRQAFCASKLVNTWASTEIAITAGRENLPFEEKWTNAIVSSVNDQLSKMVFQGQSGQTAEFEGLISILENDAATVTGATASGATAYETLKAAAKLIPVTVKNPVIMCSIPFYREFMQDLVAAGGTGLYHYDPANGENGFYLPGTDIKVIGMAGLVGADNYVIAADLNNIYFGVSADGDEDAFDLFFEPSEREFRLCINFCAGVQVAFPDEVVLVKRG